MCDITTYCIQNLFSVCVCVCVCEMLVSRALRGSEQGIGKGMMEKSVVVIYTTRTKGCSSVAFSFPGLCIT